MTVDSKADYAAPADGPSIHVRRARKLLWGGAIGGLGATVLCLAGFALGYGRPGLLSAALAAAMVLFFYGLGQYVMVLFADAGARTLLTVSLCSYTTRVVALGLVLLLYERYHQTWPTLVPMVIFVTTIAVVAGWLIVEVFVFSRLRIGVYDTAYVPPASADSAP
jgi:predicted permease